MKITFYSNFLNLHQLPMCEAFLSLPDVNFKFVACTPIPGERIRMKYEDMNHKYDFVLCSYENDESYANAMELALSSDVAIFGSTDLRFLYARMDKNLLSFRYCERALRKGAWRRFIPSTALKIYREYTRYRNKHLYIMSASAFTSHDLEICGFNSSKCIKWGYLPAVTKFDDIGHLIMQKKHNHIVWVGRFIECKHPEFAVEAARRLKSKGVDFTLDFIGNGELLENTKKAVEKYHLDDRVKFLGSLTTEEVRKKMEEASVFIFNSDRYEGWGAVVNEAMNSACAVLVSHVVGSAPFLIKHGYNGLVYEYGNIDEFTVSLISYLTTPEMVKEFGRNAYKTMTEIWNADIAVSRLHDILIQMKEDKSISLFQEGPCSIAEIYKTNWYK